MSLLNAFWKVYLIQVDPLEAKNHIMKEYCAKIFESIHEQ